MAAAEAFLERNPDTVDANLLMTETVALLSESKQGPDRRTLLERAVTHHKRVVELTKHSSIRRFSLGTLVVLHDPRYLNHLDRAETYAHMPQFRCSCETLRPPSR